MTATVLLFSTLAVAFTITGSAVVKIMMIMFLLVIVYALIGLTPHVYSVIVATETGLQWHRPFGLRTRRMKWPDISRISRPWFGVPYEVAYIISDNGERIAGVLSMSGFMDLLDLVESRAPNLVTKNARATLWRRRAPWKQLLWFIVLFLTYVIIRKLIGF